MDDTVVMSNSSWKPSTTIVSGGAMTRPVALILTLLTLFPRGVFIATPILGGGGGATTGLKNATACR